MSLPTQNINTRSLHVDAASLVVSALQITPPPVYLCKYLKMSILCNIVVQFALV